MEGPGGYQLVGRTVPVWNRFRRTSAFTEPWLLRCFDQLRFFEVTADELVDWRRDLITGKADLQVEPATLCLGDHLRAVDADADGISAFRNRQQAAFAAERARWAEADTGGPSIGAALSDGSPDALPPGVAVVETGLAASVWKVLVEVGQRLVEGDPVVVLESMKMEMTVQAPLGGRVVRVMVRPGQRVEPGQPMVAVAP
jgi:urea carboxylase